MRSWRIGELLLVGLLDSLLIWSRIQFFTLSAGDLSYAPLQSSRAAFCELLASMYSASVSVYLVLILCSEDHPGVPSSR